MSIKFDPEVSLTSVRRYLSGTNLCARRRGNGIHIFDKPVPTNPNTKQQQAVRGNVGAVGKAWRALTPEQKERWGEAAERLAPEFPESRGRMIGYTLFCHCARNCLLAGAAIPQQPPGDPRPELPRAVDLLPTDDPAKFAFVIHHGLGQQWCGSYRVVIRLSPAVTRACRAPERRESRLICGHAPASAPQLPLSGEKIEFEQARFAVAPGQRFGIWIRIVCVANGLDSGELFLEFERTGKTGR